MRLWSLHPRYLDRAGLVALWREGLLAQAVLAGLTRGYTRHPQLARFREHAAPREAIAAYLHAVAEEGRARGYAFDQTKLPPRRRACAAIAVTDGQLVYERQHLLAKLLRRDAARHLALSAVATADAHPLFVVVAGEVAAWEKRS